ncbi:MAG: fibrillarin-like rRNA/tRNA 2'-O-methyltransferase [Thermoplasmata archaeon]
MPKRNKNKHDANITFSLNPRIIRKENRIYTQTDFNKSVYGEHIYRENGKYYREWIPERSKLSAAILKGLRFFPMTSEFNVLYLGASSGTTVSHVSDIVYDGKIYAVEIGYEPFSKLLNLAQSRKNIYPILEDANHIERYEFFIDGVDMIYQDISQRNQVQIFNENVKSFSPKYAFFVLKTRSIKSSERGDKILKDSKDALSIYTVKQIVDLRPYDYDNYFIYLEI